MEQKIKAKAMCVVGRSGKEVLASLHHDNVDDERFARIIGGSIEFGEKAEEALRREFQEELGTEIENLRFLKVIENIFTYKGRSEHEVTFIYTGELADKGLYEKEEMHILDSPTIAVRWVPFDGELKLYPELDFESILKGLR